MEPEIAFIVDVETTRNLYRQFEPHRCNCAYCRNVRAQWNALLTFDLRSAISPFGIDPDKPVEIIDFGHVGEGRQCQIEWAFLAISKDVAVPAGTRQIATDTYFICPGGIPEPSFDTSGRRWSLRVDFKNVRWMIPDEEPA
jgi:hypothetical protein